MGNLRRQETLLLLAFFGVLVFLEHHVFVEGHQGKCDIYEGSWVYDQTYPLYDNIQCPFILEAFNCLQNGRPDRDFQKFRWQPSACDLPQFDGRKFLWKMRGKSIMFVGDSLGLNQWQSLVCLLHAALPHLNYTSVRTGGLSTVTFPAYDVKVMFYRNAFLVDMARTRHGAVLELDSIDAGKKWRETDVFIFDTWHWWVYRGRNQRWDSIQEGKTTYKDMNRLVAYKKALTTLAKWVDSLLRDSPRTKVFIQGVSPDHVKGSEWGKEGVRNCKEEKEPIRGSKYPGGKTGPEVVMERVMESLLKSKAGEVKLLNVTNLSQLRKDGHPSIYGLGHGRGMDCTHWCLPGVPDTWNQLLYAELFN